MYNRTVHMTRPSYHERTVQSSEALMAQTSYKISEARKNFAEILERANKGEEIAIMRGNEVYARVGPAEGGKRPFGRPSIV